MVVSVRFDTVFLRTDFYALYFYTPFFTHRLPMMSLLPLFAVVSSLTHSLPQTTLNPAQQPIGTAALPAPSTPPQTIAQQTNVQQTGTQAIAQAEKRQTQEMSEKEAFTIRFMVIGK